MLDAKSKDMRSIRGRRISMIFQEPMTPLSPLHTIGNQINKTLRLPQSMVGLQITGGKAAFIARHEKQQPAKVIEMGVAQKKMGVDRRFSHQRAVFGPGQTMLPRTLQKHS